MKIDNMLCFLQEFVSALFFPFQDIGFQIVRTILTDFYGFCGACCNRMHLFYPLFQVNYFILKKFGIFFGGWALYIIFCKCVEFECHFKYVHMYLILLYAEPELGTIKRCNGFAYTYTFECSMSELFEKLRFLIRSQPRSSGINKS